MRQKDLLWGFPRTCTSTPAPRNRGPSLSGTRTPNGCHHYPDTRSSAPTRARTCTCFPALGRSCTMPRTQGRLQLPWVLYLIYPNVPTKGMIPRCSSSTCPLIRGRKRVVSQNSDCAAGFCTQSSTCIWRIKVGQKTVPTMPVATPAPPRTPEPI